MSDLSVALVFAAGLGSVLSPCVVPVIPLVVTGGAEDHKARPLLIVAGLAASFITMGVLSSLFGTVVGPLMYKLERVIGAVIALIGVLLMFDVNPFKRLSALSAVGSRGGGRINGFALGLLLGIIWIPCVGPMLSGVLAFVATQHRVAAGVGYLLVYSAGWAVPLLVVAYASQAARDAVRSVARAPRMLNAVSGLLLVALGTYIAFNGLLAFSGLVT